MTLDTRSAPAWEESRDMISNTLLRPDQLPDNHENGRSAQNAARNIRPEFIRLPRPRERCSLTGLSRSLLANVTVPNKANKYNPPVPAKLLRPRGSTRGIWLIPTDRLIDFLYSLPSDREETRAAESDPGPYPARRKLK